MRKYVQNHVLNGAYGALGDVGYQVTLRRDSVTELYFDDLESMGQTFADPYAHELVGPAASPSCTHPINDPRPVPRGPAVHAAHGRLREVFTGKRAGKTLEAITHSDRPRVSDPLSPSNRPLGPHHQEEPVSYPPTAHPRGEARRREEAVEPPAYRRDLRFHPLHDRDERGRSAGDQSRKDCRQTGL
ncbi:hypothetical protein FGD71_004075 [Streptomyces sporangiiformans]|uniref:EthD domain-containing protein n=1 Tax=Streptomyces sporangiiformans TaxID=2315329 RepID=A0A505DQ54_9ACTN|nr:hypothetical protein FGD71_004075 [Streptomyces sporangiiformans]